MTWAWAFAGGVVGGGLVVGLLALRTRSVLASRVERIAEESIGDRDAREALARDARIIQSKLAQYGEAYATNQASKTAQNLLRTEYGITPDRLERLQALAAEYS